MRFARRCVPPRVLPPPVANTATGVRVPVRTTCPHHVSCQDNMNDRLEPIGRTKYQVVAGPVHMYIHTLGWSWGDRARSA